MDENKLNEQEQFINTDMGAEPVNDYQTSSAEAEPTTDFIDKPVMDFNDSTTENTAYTESNVTNKKKIEELENKFNSLPYNAKKAIVLVGIVIAYLLGIGSHMLVGIKPSVHEAILEQNATQKQLIEQHEATIANNTNKIAEYDKKIAEYESIIQPYKDLSAAQIAEQTAAANLKAEQDRQALEAQQAAEKAAAEKAAAEKAAAEKAAAEKAAAEAAAEKAKGYNTGITYNQLARTPDDYIGKKVKFRGKVLQVIEGDTDTQIRLAVNSNYDNVIYASVPKEKTSNMRILEDDNITIFGVSLGLISYTSTLGGKITIPSVSVDDWGPN